METVFLIFKNLIFIDFQWKLFCLFSFLSKKSFVRKINANRKCFFKKEIGCREIALTLLFLELRVHILRWCRYGAETHESGMPTCIIISHNSIVSVSLSAHIVFSGKCSMLWWLWQSRAPPNDFMWLSQLKRTVTSGLESASELFVKSIYCWGRSTL